MRLQRNFEIIITSEEIKKNITNNFKFSYLNNAIDRSGSTEWNNNQTRLTKRDNFSISYRSGLNYGPYFDRCYAYYNCRSSILVRCTFGTDFLNVLGLCRPRV